jgi:hypothetical protein
LLNCAPVSEQRVDERRRGAAAEKHEQAEQQHGDDDRREPPLFVLGQEVVNSRARPIRLPRASRSMSSLRSSRIASSLTETGTNMRLY